MSGSNISNNPPKTTFTFGGKKQKRAIVEPTVENKTTNIQKTSDQTMNQELQTRIRDIVTGRMDPESVSKMSEDDLIVKLEKMISKIIDEESIQANKNEQHLLAKTIVSDMIGLGPLESLKNAENITDIMVNGPFKVFVEQNGRTQEIPLKFRSEDHLREIANRIARSMNRPLDEANPLLDARLKDGSRVNIVIPPVAIDGTSISIRKFSKDKMTLDMLANPQNGREPALSEKMKEWLAMAARARYNIIISGGTSTGKAQPLWAPVLTPDGFKDIGSLNINDKVIALDGTESKVIGVFDHEPRHVFQITLENDSYAHACLEHLWKASKDKINWYVVNTQTLCDGDWYLPQYCPETNTTNPVKIRTIQRFSFEAVRCIAIDHPEHCYITNHNIITHNTTMLNAVSRYIESNERIVTIEDAAELQLQQPHVVRLETRRNTGSDSMGEDIDQGRLVVNALRMRPDRIILGEVRGREAFDLLAAMNTGHDGSLGTLHANTPRDALSRLENMVLMSGYDLPSRVIRSQIQSAVDMIIQIARLPDGSRRIMSISEVVGLEGEVITMQELFRFEIINRVNGKIIGEFVSTGNKPYNQEKLKNYGLEEKARKLFTE